MKTDTQRRFMVAGILLAAALCLSVFALGGAGAIFRFWAPANFTLSNHTPEVVAQAQLENNAEPHERMRIVVGLKLRNEAELDALLVELADPDSPLFMRYLSPEQFVERFSPTVHDLDRVLSYLREYGIDILQVTANRTLVEAEGTVSQLESAFGVKINRYTLSLGSAGGDETVATFLSNDRDPSIPTSLEHIIQAVIGLNTFEQMERRSIKESRGAAPGKNPVGLTPHEVASIYSFPSTLNKGSRASLTGAGRTIAIATAYSYDPKDIDEFWKTFSIARTGKLIDVHVGGVSTTPDEETTLDLQMASAQAPGADIMMYMAVDPQFTNFTLTFNKIVTDNLADIMSISWGLCEEHTGLRQMRLEQAIFKQGEAQGMAIFAASGDDGAYDCRHEETGTGNKKKVVAKYSVDYPAADPHVVAVGGTTLVNRGGSRVAEWAWTGSGGGKSDHWQRPSWQTGSGIPSGKMRALADVALNADPSSGYAVYFEGEWSKVGGTSASAPCWAALWALSSEACGRRVGSAHSLIYRMGRSPQYGKLFHDIKSGDNGGSLGPGYKAGPNWDYPTGWGVPHGEAIKDWIVKQLP